MSKKAGEIRSPGIIRTLAGNLLDLPRLKPEDIHITDIAWGLGRTLRYGGHIREDWTVAHHSIVMSYAVPEEFAKEALLHDAAEAYVGDIIWPIKALFPMIETFENSLAYKIMNRFGVSCPRKEVVYYVGDDEHDSVVVYQKSDEVAKMDDGMLQHECFGFGRPGIYRQDIEDAWLNAAKEHMEYWWAPQYAFLERFDQLWGTDYLNLDKLTELWFKPAKLKQEPKDGDSFAELAVD